MAAPKNRDQNEASKIIAESVEICKTMSLMIFGMGRTMTMLSFKPKQAAAHAMEACEELKGLSEQVFSLAERIISWDETRIIHQGKALVDVHNNPIDS